MGPPMLFISGSIPGLGSSNPLTISVDEWLASSLVFRRRKMRLNPPKKITYWVSIAVAVIGFVLYALTYAGVVGITWLSLVGVLLLAAAFILLVLGLMIKGL